MVNKNPDLIKSKDPRVKLLSDHTASKIAAGEVIESPLSVVKELVENSLDANSSNIHVVIDNGGLKKITVLDNGDGVHPNDLELIFKRFATSKIISIDDLFSLNTLGFRGEALPSISAVARINLISKTSHSSGYEIEIFNSEKIKHKPASLSKGTIIEVTNLFKNVPARLKFLSSSNQEASKIKTLLSDYSIIHPNVKFSLISDGVNKFSTPGTGNILDAYSSIHGHIIAKSMLEIEDDDFISGLTSNTTIARGNRSNIKFSVNGRIIKTSSLVYAVETAYSGLIEPRRYPFTFINIKIDPSLIDVNVHPAKTEIRFRSEAEIFRSIVHNIRATLTIKSSIPEINYNKDISDSRRQDNSNLRSSINIQNSQSLLTRSTEFEGNKKVLNNNFVLKEEKLSLQESIIIGTLENTFIVCTHNSGLLIIDQHGAHERINFESIQENLRTNTNNGQRLLEPVVIDLDEKKFNVLISQKEILQKFGFDFEVLDNTSVLIRSIPILIAGFPDINGKIIEIIDDMVSPKITDWQYWISAELACKSSVKAKTKLTIDECKELVRKLGDCEEIHDPHGRPIIMRLPINTIKNQFHRS